MSVQFGLPRLFQFGDPNDEIAWSDGDPEYGLEPDYDNPELYGDEESGRVLHRQPLLDHD